MKKSHLKSILGASIVLASITNTQSSTLTKKNKVLKTGVSFSKVKDQSDNQDVVSDGSKTERTRK